VRPSPRATRTIAWSLCALSAAFFFTSLFSSNDDFPVGALLVFASSEGLLPLVGALSRRLLGVIETTMHPTHISFWLRDAAGAGP
jgi:hypothetical protein